MAKLVFENISMKNAKIFADWYEGQGEQDADVWFQDRDSRAPLTDVGRKGGYLEIKDNSVHVYLKDN